MEHLKKKNNDLELEVKIKEGEYEKNVSNHREQLAEAVNVRDLATKQLKLLETSKGTMLAQTEEKYKQTVRELEQLCDAKDKEIDDVIQDHNFTSEKKLNEIRKFYEEEKERLEARLKDEKARFEKKLS